MQLATCSTLQFAHCTFCTLRKVHKPVGSSSAAKRAHKSTISASATGIGHPISLDVSEIILNTLIIRCIMIYHDIINTWYTIIITVIWAGFHWNLSTSCFFLSQLTIGSLGEGGHHTQILVPNHCIIISCHLLPSYQNNPLIEGGYHTQILGTITSSCHQIILYNLYCWSVFRHEFSDIDYDDDMMMWWWCYYVMMIWL